MITTYHNISFGTQTVPEQIPVVQGDTGREIVFILTDFTIPEGATATYYVQKPSGEAVYNTATISENNIIVPLTAQSIIEVGENDMQVRVILDEDIVTSFRAILMVRPFLGIGAIESSTEINIFDQAVEAAKEEIIAAVGEAEGEIETATEEAIAQVHESALAFFVTDTASGAIATFPDGADLVPVKALTVEIEPVQDLHGQTSPYPSGGGKNQFNPTTGGLNPGTYNGITYTKNADGSFSFSGTATASTWIDFGNVTLPSGTWTASVTKTGSYTGTVVFGANSGAFNPYQNLTAYPRTGESAEETTGKFSVNFSAGASITGTLTLWIQIESGSTASTWSPYSNICPITGHTQAVVVDAQRYVLLRPDAPQTYTEHGVTWDASRFPFITAKGTASGGTSYSGTIGGRSQDNSLTAGTYTFKVVGDIDNAYIVLQVGSGSTQSLSKSTKEITVTVAETSSLSWYCNVPNNTAVDAKFAFVIGDANVYEIDLDGTRYGGTLDVLSGVLTVTGANIASYNGETLPGEWISDRDVYAAGTTPTTGAQVVYELATPLTVQLTAEEVTTLLGQNNIFADCGDVSCEYRADTKLYIEKILNA